MHIGGREICTVGISERTVNRGRIKDLQISLLIKTGFGGTKWWMVNLGTPHPVNRGMVIGNLWFYCNSNFGINFRINLSSLNTECSLLWHICQLQFILNTSLNFWFQSCFNCHCIHFDQFDHVYILIIIYNVILQLLQFLFIYEIILIALFASNNVTNNKVLPIFKGIGSWL